MEIKNEALLNPLFSQGMQRVCSQIWGSKIDREILLLLDLILEKQNELSRLYKKYSAEASEEAATAWSEIAHGTSEIDADKIPLDLGEGKQLSAMERYHLRSVFEISDK